MESTSTSARCTRKTTKVSELSPMLHVKNTTDGIWGTCLLSMKNALNDSRLKCLIYLYLTIEVG